MSRYPVVFRISLLFPKDTRPLFWGFLGPRPIRKSDKAVFLEDYEACGANLLPISISDARAIRTPGVAASCRCCTSLRGKRFDFASFRGFVRSRRPATAYGFRTIFIWPSNCEIFTFFSPPCSSHPPMARRLPWPSRHGAYRAGQALARPRPISLSRYWRSRSWRGSSNARLTRRAALG
jgi:hypothetical protein